MYKKILFLILTIILISSCSPDALLDKAMDEEFEYKTFEDNGFSIEYPDWPTTEGDAEVSVSRGYCTVIVNSEKMLAKQWYDAIIDATGEEDIMESDEDSYSLTSSALYQDIKLISNTKIYDCKDNSIAVIVSCIEQADEKVEDIREQVFNSVSCNEEEQEYSTFEEEDFIVEYPKDWNELDLEEEQRILSKTKGVCSLIVDKHNALPEDIYNWVETAVEENNDQDLLEASKEDNTYNIIYELPYEESIVTATTKVFYCNYQSYVTQVLCVNEFNTEEYEILKDEILDSSKCKTIYEIPTPEVIEEQKEEIIEEEPEVIEEIEDEIVKTNMGEEFGIDEEMIVYFINSNVFFTNIMKDFPKVNLVMEDDDRNLELKATIGSDGKITLLEDGLHGDADVTIYVPLRDALNIFSNANNINPLTLLSFAVNVRTEPVEIKDQVIRDVIAGKYN